MWRTAFLPTLRSVLGTILAKISTASSRFLRVYCEAHALTLEILDALYAGALARHDGERLVGVVARGVVHDDADHLERIAAVARLEEGGHAHVADLNLALLHGGDHVGPGVHDSEAHL